jgi:serine/threonine protein kinase
MGLDTVRGAMQSVGHYDLLEKIAEGGMGAIYRGRDRRTGMVVAIKVMAPHIAANPVLVKRFEQEFKAASRLDHPNVVRAIDYGGGDGGTTPFLVMEYVDGESLGQKIEREGKMTEVEAIRILAQVAQGLHRAHKMNLVHRDVKPDNILIEKTGNAKLADLGLVKETETDLNLTKTGRGLGTPHFMAPEQFRNAKNADIRCDIYSLGATLYQLVTGKLPFGSTSGPLDAWMKKIQNELEEPKSIVSTLTDRVNWAILRAMSADPEQRPRSCREFIEDLTGHSTKRVQTVGAGANPDLWYLIYSDEEGTTHTVKGTTSAIRRSLKDGHLGDAENVRASKSKSGPFEALRGYPEFRDLLVSPAPLQMPGVNQPRNEAAVPTRPAYREPTTPESNSGHRALPHVPAPHIDLEERREEPPSVPPVTWLIAMIIAIVSATVTFYLFTK